MSGEYIGIDGIGVFQKRTVRDIVEEIIATAPVNVAVPAVLGDPAVGETLVATNGVWTTGGAGIASFSYRWLRDDTPIPGATSATYAVVEEDFDKTLSVEVVASNAQGVGVAVSDPTGAIVLANSVPVNTGLPTITGIAREDETLAASSNGNWIGNGDEILDFNYQWLADGVAVAGKTGTTFRLTNAEVGKRISLRVTATNSIGDTVATSLQTAAVVAAVFFPAIVAAPQITGVVKDGNTLTVSNGTWNNGGSPITYSYQWFANDLPIAGATGSTLLLDEDNIGQAIRAEVTATNEAGSITATTQPTAPVIAAIGAPINTTLPTTSPSTMTVASLVTASDGVWDDNGSEITLFSYQWYANGVLLEGEVESTFQLSPPYLNMRLEVEVTATSAAGSTTARSLLSKPVYNVPSPSVITKPTIESDYDVRVGATVTATQGTWNEQGVETTYTYQWRTISGNIAGATGTSFTIPEELLGQRLAVSVTATNSGGSRPSTSSYITVLEAGTAPVNTVLPTIVGVPEENVALVVANGTWTSTGGPIEYSYQWYADGDEIVGADEQSFTPSSAEAGARISVVVTATNVIGSASVTSAETDPVLAANGPPVNLSPPVIEGNPAISNVTTVTPGTWDDRGAEITDVEYAWYADGDLIAGASGTSYEIDPAYEGMILTVTETVTNSYGSASATSAPSLPIEGTYDPATAAYVDAMDVAPQSGTIQVIDTFIKGMKDAGLWDRFGYVGIYAVHDEQAARVNAKNPSIVATRMESYPFIPFEGWKGSPTNYDLGGSGYLDTGMTLVEAGAMRGDMTVAVWQGRNEPLPLGGGSPAPVTGEVGLDNNLYMVVSGRRNINATTTARVFRAFSSSTRTLESLSPSVYDTYGEALIGFTRPTTSSAFNAYLDKVATSQTASPQLDNDVDHITVGKIYSPTALGGGRSTQLIRMVLIGAFVTQAEWEQVHDLISAYMDAISDQVPSLAPANTTAPSLNKYSNVRSGDVLTANRGVWNEQGETTTYQYRWFAGATQITGATGLTLSVTDAMIGETISFRVTATNAGGSTNANSPSTDAVAEALTAPVNTVLPSISGTVQEGETLTASNGTWTTNGAAISSYQYQWFSNGSAISGATENTYLLTSSEVGKVMTVRVTAVNSVGSTPATSAATSAVLAAPAAYDADTDTYLAAMSTAPEPERADAIDELVLSLKSSGLWSKIGWMSIHAMHDEQAARINLKNPSQVATRQESYPFEVNKGFRGNPSGPSGQWGYLDTGYTLAQLATDVGASRSGISVGAWAGQRFDRDAAYSAVENPLPCEVGYSTRSDVYVASRTPNSTDSLLFQNAPLAAFSSNDFTNNPVQLEGVREGLVGFTRTISSSYQGFTHGKFTAVKSLSATSGTFPSTGSFWIGRSGAVSGRGNTRSKQLIRMAYMATGLTTAEVLALEGIFAEFLSKVELLDTTEPQVYNTEATAFFNSLEKPLATSRKNAINTFIGALKTAGVWAKTDWLSLHSMPHERAARTNLINPSQIATREEDYQFIPYTGWHGEQLTGYLTLPITYADLNQVTQNSVTLAVESNWISAGSLQNARVDLGILGSSYLYLNTLRSTGEFSVVTAVSAISNNSSRFETVYNSGSIVYTTYGRGALFAGIRRGATDILQKKHKTNPEKAGSSSYTLASEAITAGHETLPICIGRGGTHGSQSRSSRRITFAYIGAGLNDTEWNALVDAYDAYSNAVTN